jgi:hypothetical protein
MNNIEKPQKQIGRPPGSFSHETMKKMALKFIEKAVLDETISPEARLQAALRLTEVDHGTQ